MNYGEILFKIVIAWNIFVFVLFGIDKFRSIHQQRRLRERTLLRMAFFMGGTGALLGMFVFMHKVKHKDFLILVPSFTALNLLTMFLLWKFVFV